ncbi:acyl-CoA dehydrogenase [Anaerovorax odorimutans]|uniref:Acyl-CoA dehydrogenase n=1 Tax=Anaerovorax odorimutans TaxID=109327 RepID=A0ABT1RPA4_9FIRM|nr:acyl-CoA dehydrogenase [Anaerovorax odorimutans]MCQ4636998.1 acyl-CoA dehydrogenase [Anaerovorax odorimutans]
MEFTYSREQQMVKKMIKEFAETEIAPIAEELDAEAKYPYETVAKLGKLGVMGMPFPKEYGGAGTDYLTYIMAVEELSKVDASHGVIVQTHNALCCWPIFTYGTEEQKRKYLPDLLSGKKLGAFGLTEPNAGTDAAMQQTTAADGGDCWILNGSKVFISGGGIADVYVIMAMTDKSKGNKGISSFIVEKGTPGFSRGKKENKMGIRASIAAELVFEDCRIPKENLLGKEGKGFKTAMTSLDVGRLGIAAQALGIAQGAFDQTVEYMKQRKQFGRSLNKFQALAFEMANMKTRIDGARFLLYNACNMRDRGLPSTVEAAQAKLACSETASYVVDKAVQFHGGYGYIKDYPVERMYRDQKITEIYEGTSEVMKMVISGSIFK